jgi:myosin heavy subunit
LVAAHNKHLCSVIVNIAMDVGDLARLTNLTSASMVEVLRARFAGDIVYTYITNMLLAVNPHKPLPIYGLCRSLTIGFFHRHASCVMTVTGRSELNAYRGQPIGSQPPHIFAIADAAYTSLFRIHKDACIVISGPIM